MYQAISSIYNEVFTPLLRNIQFPQEVWELEDTTLYHSIHRCIIICCSFGIHAKSTW